MTARQALGMLPRFSLGLRDGTETWIWGTVLVLIAAACYLGPFVLPLSMASFGAPGCTLYQSAQAISPPTSTGTPLAFVVPAAPGFEGITIFAQCVILDVSANPNAAGLVFTDAIKMTTTL